MQGQFVGVNELATSTGAFYARSVGTALEFAQELIKQGEVHRVDLGLDPSWVTDDDARQELALPMGGVYINGFKAGSPLEAAGLHRGDVINGIVTCSGPGEARCDIAAATIHDPGELDNVLAFASSSQELIIQALRPPPCALEALQNNAAPPADCLPDKQFLQSVRIRLQ